MKPASCRSRQKSFRGFANAAPADAEARPGLMPQKTTSRPGPRMSGTAELSAGGSVKDGRSRTSALRSCGFLPHDPRSAGGAPRATAAEGGPSRA